MNGIIVHGSRAGKLVRPSEAPFLVYAVMVDDDFHYVQIELRRQICVCRGETFAAYVESGTYSQSRQAKSSVIEDWYAMLKDAMRKVEGLRKHAGRPRDRGGATRLQQR